MSRRLYPSRAAAALLAAVAWYCLIGTFAQLSKDWTDLAEGFAMLTLYYTDWAIFLTAIFFTGIAAGKVYFARHANFGHVVVVLAIMMVMYWTFQGMPHMLKSRLAAQIAHTALFPAALLYWLVFHGREPARWRHALRWTMFPFLYTVYGLTRGYITKNYPYTQANFEVLGMKWVGGMIFLTIVLSIVVGLALVLWDKWIFRKNAHHSQMSDPEADENGALTG